MLKIYFLKCPIYPVFKISIPFKLPLFLTIVDYFYNILFK